MSEPNESSAQGSGAAFDPSEVIHPLTTMPIDALKAHPRNYRRHPEDQIDHLARSIEDHGFYRPVVVANDDVVLAGHGILTAAKRLRLTEVPVVRIDVASDDPKALKILTGDNELGRLAEIDDRALSSLLKEIKDVDELLGTGFDPMMLANLVMVTRPQSEIEDIDEAAEWVGLPEYVAEDKPPQVIVSFDSEADRLKFLETIGIERTHFKNGRVWSTWWPFRERQDLASVKFAEQRNG